jgi:hypothetical protein
MNFFYSKNKKLPSAAQKGLLPRKEFMAQGKGRFLAAFDASEFARDKRSVRPAYLTLFFKAGIGAIALFCVAAGVSAYADTANVSPASPLYPLKRLSESVRVVLAPAPEKAQLQATFAVRRADEIAALQTSAPSSTLIPKLTTDLDQDISSSLNVGGNNEDNNSGANNNSNDQHRHGHDNGVGPTAMNTSTATTTIASAPISNSSSTNNTGLLNVYCDAFNRSTSGVLVGHLESGLVRHPDVWSQFNQRCGSESDGSQAGDQQQSQSQNQNQKESQSGHGHRFMNESTTIKVQASSSLDL